MFDIFKKTPKVNLSVQVDHPQQAYFRGDTVHATVTVSSEHEVQLREARVALVLAEADRYDKDRAPSPDKREVDGYSFMQAGSISTAPQTFTHDFKIPGDAAPTFQGDAIHIQWFVNATVHLQQGPDVSAQTEFGVTPAPPASVSSPGEFGKVDTPDASIAIWLSKAEGMLGETIEGKLLVNPAKSFDVAMLMVALQLYEQIALPNIKTHTETGGDMRPLAVRAKFEAGQSLEYPFSLKLPSKPQPTFEGPRSWAKWFIKATCMGQHQIEAQAPIQVYGAVPLTSPSDKQ